MSDDAAAVLAAYPDLYAVLNVPSDATDAQIKKGYHRRALHLHPDKNSSPTATEAFKRVGRAFEILSDSDRRFVYDEAGGGKAGLDAVTGAETGEGGPGLMEIVRIVAGWLRVGLAATEAPEHRSTHAAPWTMKSCMIVLGFLVVSFLVVLCASAEQSARRPPFAAAKSAAYAESLDVPVAGLAVPKVRVFRRSAGAAADSHTTGAVAAAVRVACEAHAYRAEAARLRGLAAGLRGEDGHFA